MNIITFVKPPRPEGRGFASRAYAPGKEDKHSCIAPLDPALKDGGSALRQHFVRGEQAGQTVARKLSQPIGRMCVVRGRAKKKARTVGMGLF